MKTNPRCPSRSTMLTRCVATALSAVAVAAIALPANGHDETQTGLQRGVDMQVLSSQLYASPSQVRLVQEALRERGFDPGRVDGVWGEATASAVSRFQKEQQLVQTGKLDTSLLAALDIGDVLEGKTSSSFLDGLLSADRSQAKGGQGNGAPIYVSPFHVAQIQHVLHERGLYKGTVDGLWGDSTAEALNRYRVSTRLDADQGIDIALLRAMNRESSDLPKLGDNVAAAAQAVPLRAGPATLRALQRELSARGHQVGAVDGEWGANTRDAVAQFQRAHQLEPTGTLTLPTLAALGIDIKNTRQAAADGND